MEKINFNFDWSYSRIGEKNKKKCELPHDAMIYEQRSLSSQGGINISYFEGYDYEYEKEFIIDKTLLDKIIYLEFEGVYKDAEIYINNEFVMKENYGYNGFFAEINKFIHEGKNILVVKCFNSDQPNSRWYTGSGIYRNVNMLVFEKEHILLNGIKISTKSYLEKMINLDVLTTSSGKINVEFYQNDKLLDQFEFETDGHLNKDIALKDALLWSNKEPNLIYAKLKFNNDEQIIRFGIREVKLNLNKGLLINGERVILLGGCIHHDNGLIGARNIDFAEYRKAKLIKEAGYNAVRSAHNPCSKEFLDACDELGLLVMDEYVDCWYIHKTYYDYALHMEKNWPDDLRKMVDKDFNHPSVILYSVGNEVSETGQKKGIELVDKMVKYLHSLDNRYVTCGVNIFFNFLSSINLGVYSDNKAQKEINSNKKKKAVGSQFFNDLAGIMGASFMKKGATLPACDRKTKDAFAKMDIAGYNYGIERYKHDLKKYPARFILGTETFCSDAFKFYNFAQDNVRLIGDFAWAAMDYIGEVGVGSWTVDEYCNNDFTHQVGWLTAGSGRIDITGKITCEGDYTRVCYDLIKMSIGVVPVHHFFRKHSPSAWKFSMAEKSWSYEGFEGEKTIVEVYSKAPIIELYLNDKLIGKKKNKEAICKFKVKYYPGKLTAKGYDKNKKIICEESLISAEKETILTAKSEISSFKKGDLIYLRFSFTDKNGIYKPTIKENIKIDKIINGELLGFGNGCSYSEKGYITNECETFYGEAVAVIKPTSNQDVTIEASSKYGKTSTLVIAEK